MTTKPPPDTIYSFKGNQTEIHCLNFLLNSSEEKLLSGTRNGEVFIWDLESLTLCHSFQAGDGPCISILLPDDQHLLTHSRGDAIRKWTRKSDGTFTETSCLASNSLQYCSAQLVEANASNEKLFVFPDGGAKAVSVAEVQGMEVVSNLSYPDSVGNIMGLTAAGKGQVLAVFEAGDIILWDVRKSAPLRTHKMHIGEADMTTAMCIGYNSDKSVGIIGSSNPQIDKFALSQRNEIRTLPSVKITNAGVNQFSFRNDNKLLASAGWDSSVRVFAVRGADSKVPLRPLAVLPSYTSDKSLTCVLFSPTPVNNLNNKFILAAGGEGCTLCLWDIYN